MSELQEAPIGEELSPEEEQNVREMLAQMQASQEELDGPANIERSSMDEAIRVKSDTEPMRLAHFLLREVAEKKLRRIRVQTIGPRALSKAVFAIVHMNTLIEPHTPDIEFVIHPHIRVKQMRNEEERTAFVLTICQIPTRYVI